jgi:hypothetical protein
MMTLERKENQYSFLRLETVNVLILAPERARPRAQQFSQIARYCDISSSPDSCAMLRPGRARSFKL